MRCQIRKIKVLLSIVAVVPAVSGWLSAAPGTTAANFLKLPQGNRATAMGSSFTANAEGPTAVFWNPAGLANGPFNEARMVYNDWIEGIYYGYAAYRHRIDRGGFGFAVTYLNSGSITRRETGRECSGSAYYLQDIAVDFGEGIYISDTFNVGVLLKLISEYIDGESANSLAGGLGGQYRKQYRDHFLSAGLALMNLGTEMGYDSKYPLPVILRMGVSDELPGSGFSSSAQIDMHTSEGAVTGGAGVELQAASFLKVRLGYRFGYRDVPFPYGITAGFGVTYTDVVDYLFDYSVSTLGDLGFVNRIGFGIKF